MLNDGEPQKLYDRPTNGFVTGFIVEPLMHFMDVNLVKSGDTAKKPIRREDVRMDNTYRVPR